MRLIAFFLVCLSLQPLFAASPEFGLELWLFRPKADLPPIEETRERGGVTHSWGPFSAELGTITEKSRVAGLHFNDDRLTIDSITSDIGLASLVAKSSVGFGRHVTLYRIYDVGFVSHTRRPLTFPAPARIDVRILPTGRVELRDRAALVAHFQNQVDTVISDGTWDQNFTYFYKGLPQYAMYLGDKVFRHYRADILAMARDEVKKRFDEPAFLDRFTDQIAASLPPLQSQEFRGFDASIERQPTGWRFRPADFEGQFSAAVTSNIPITDGEANRASLVVRGSAVRAQFANFLGAVERGSQDIPALPQGLTRHASRAALTFDIGEQEGFQLKNFLQYYAKDLTAASYRYGVFIGGAEAPKVSLCRNHEWKTFLDVQATLLAEASQGDRTIPLVLRFQVEGAASNLKLVNLRRPGEEPSAKPVDMKPIDVLAAKMKFLVLQSLVNQRLDEALRFAKDALKPGGLEIKGLRMLGETSAKCDSQTAEAEAIALDLALAP